MPSKTLTETVRIGRSTYQPGTVVETGREPIHPGTRHECWLVRFPKGEETYLTSGQVQ